MKKIISLLVILVISLCNIQMFALAKTTVPTVKEGDWYFTENYNGDCIAYSYVGTNTTVKVPSTFNGRDVCFVNKNFLKNCTQKDNVKEIYLPSTFCGIADVNNSYDANDQDHNYLFYLYKSVNFNYCKGLENIEVSSANQNFCDESGCVYSKNKKELYFVPNKFGASAFRVPATVKTIYDISSETIKTLTIPAKVKALNLNCVDCPNATKLYVYTKSADVVGCPKIAKGAKVYCYKNSNVYKNCKNNKITVVSEPKKPAKTQITSVKFCRCADIGAYAVKVSYKNAKASGYNIYRYNADKKKYEYIGVTVDLSFVDVDAEIGKTYKYKVAPFNTKNGLDSFESKTSAKKITVGKLPTPKKAEFSATAKGTKVTINIKKLSAASSYNIYKYNSTTKTYKCLCHANYLTKFTDYDVKSGKTYKYKVRACAYTADGKYTKFGKYSDVKKVTIK